MIRPLIQKTKMIRPMSALGRMFPGHPGVHNGHPEIREFVVVTVIACARVLHVPADLLADLLVFFNSLPDGLFRSGQSRAR